MKDSQAVWIARDKAEGYDYEVDMSMSKPYLNSHEGFFESTGKHAILHVEAFKDIFGFTPRKGSCKQYELTLKEIK